MPDSPLQSKFSKNHFLGVSSASFSCYRERWHQFRPSRTLGNLENCQSSQCCFNDWSQNVHICKRLNFLVHQCRQKWELARRFMQQSQDAANHSAGGCPAAACARLCTCTLCSWPDLKTLGPLTLYSNLCAIRMYKAWKHWKSYKLPFQ